MCFAEGDPVVVVDTQQNEKQTEGEVVSVSQRGREQGQTAATRHFFVLQVHG